MYGMEKQLVLTKINKEMTNEDKNTVLYWFGHIAQIATDRKTANGVVMEDWAALDEIAAIAKDSMYYIKNHCNE